MSPPSVPEEIWRLIADLVVEDTRLKEFPRQLMSVNQAFLNYYLDATYEEVHWTKLDKPTVKQLERLRSPIIASHVKRLRIHTWHIDHLMNRDNMASPSGFSPLVALQKAFSKYILRRQPPPVQELECAEELFTKRYDQRNQARALDGAPSVKPIITAMISAMQHMSNLTYYNLELRDVSFNEETTAFLTTARESFASSLRRLVLRFPIRRFQSVLGFTDFPHLDDLQLHFDYEGSDSSDVLIQSVVPFINSRRGSLQSLGISSYSTADLSLFFDALGPFATLRRLSLHIFFDEPHLSDPQALFRFLGTCKGTLHHVVFRSRTPDQVENEVRDKEAFIAARLEAWNPIQSHLLNDASLLTNLKTLSLSSSTLEDVMPLVERSIETLTHLELFDTKLRLEELKTLLAFLKERAVRLRHLHIEIEEMTAEVIHKLSIHLPALQSLVLVYGRIQYVTFRTEMHFLKLSGLNWHLEHLSLFEGRCIELPPHDIASKVVVEYSNATSVQEYEVMLAISKGVGSIKTFKGCRVRNE